MSNRWTRKVSFQFLYYSDKQKESFNFPCKLCSSINCFQFDAVVRVNGAGLSSLFWNTRPLKCHSTIKINRYPVLGRAAILQVYFIFFPLPIFVCDHIRTLYVQIIIVYYKHKLVNRQVYFSITRVPYTIIIINAPL